MILKLYNRQQNATPFAPIYIECLLLPASQLQGKNDRLHGNRFQFLAYQKH